MILSKKLQIELNKRQCFIISTLLGILDDNLNQEKTVDRKVTQSVFYKDEVERIGGTTLKLKINESIKEKLREDLEIYDNYLFLTNKAIAQIENIEKVKLLSFSNNYIQILILYEVQEREIRSFNKRLLSIYLAEYEPVTVLDSGNGSYFVDGMDYLDKLFFYIDEIERLFLIRKKQLKVDQPEPTKRINRLIKKCSNVLKDSLHKLTRRITDYCITHDVTAVIVGKAKEVSVFPINRFVNQLRYKLKLEGIPLVFLNDSKNKMDYLRLSQESHKLEEKIKQTSNWELKEEENQLAAFSMFTDYMKEMKLEPSFG